MSTVYYAGESGKNYYGKPRPLVASPWSSGVISGVRNGSTNEIAFNVDDTLQGGYWIFERAGASPASGDTIIASIPGAGIEFIPPATVSIADTKPLTILWPVDGDTITGEVSIDNGAFQPCAGTPITQVGTIDGPLYSYTLPYSAADRPSGEGTAVYRFTGSVGSPVYQALLTLKVIPIAAGTGTGSHTVTTTVTSSSVAIVGANVVVYSGSTLVGWGTTNSSGQVVFNLNAGAYTFTVRTLTGYAPHTPVARTISGTTSVSLTLTAQTIAPPTIPGLCAVRFSVLKNGSPVQGAIVKVRLEGEYSVASTAIASNAEVSGITNGSGYCDIMLVQQSYFSKGGVYQVDVYDRNNQRELLYSRRVLVPDLTVATADQLIDACGSGV